MPCSSVVVTDASIAASSVLVFNPPVSLEELVICDTTAISIFNCAGDTKGAWITVGERLSSQVGIRLLMTPCILFFLSLLCRLVFILCAKRLQHLTVARLALHQGCIMQRTCSIMHTVEPRLCKFLIPEPRGGSSEEAVHSALPSPCRTYKSYSEADLSVQVKANDDADGFRRAQVHVAYFCNMCMPSRAILVDSDLLGKLWGNIARRETQAPDIEMPVRTFQWFCRTHKNP